MGSVDYIVRFKGDYSALAKDMSKINAETKKLEDDEVIIKLDYDGNIKEFNKVFDEISKMHPELGIQFQYNVNKKMLDKELDKLEKLTSIKADIDERKVVDKLKNLGNDVKSSIQDGLSKEEVTKRLETFFGYYNTAVKAGAKNIDVDFSNIHDEIFKSFSSAADDIKEVYDEVWDTNENKKIELFTIDKSINDDLLATKNRIDDLNESLANLEKKGASKTKVPSQIKVLQDEIRIIKSDIEDMQEKLKNLSGDKFDEITEKVRDLEKALRDTSEKFDEVIKDKIEKIFSELDIGNKNSRLFADIGKKIIDSIIAGVKDSHSDEDLADILLNTVNSAFEGVVLNSVTDALINEVYQKMGDGLHDHKFEIVNFDAKTDTLVGSIQDGLNEYTFSIDLGGTIKSLSSALDTSADNVRMSFMDAIKWMNQANEWQKNNRDARHERQLFFNTKTGQFSNPTVIGDRDSVSPKLIKSMVEYYKKQGIAFDTDLHTHPDVDFAAPSGFDGDFRKFFSSAFQDGIDKFIVMAQKELAVFDFSKLSSSTDEFKEFINNWISDNLKEIEQEIGKQDKLSDNDYIAKYLDKIYSNLRETIYKNLKSSTNEEAEISGAEAKKTSKAIFKDLNKNILTNPITGNLNSQIIDLFSDIEIAIKKELNVKQITNPLNNAIKDVFRRVGDEINSLKDEDKLTPEELSLKVSDAILDSGLFDKGQFANLSGELQYKIQKKIIDQIIGLFSIEHSNFNYKTDQQLNHEAGSMAMKEIMSSSSAAGKLLNQFVNYYSHEEFEKKYGSKLPTSSEQNQAEVSTSPTLSDDFQTQLQDAINKSGEYYVDISGQLINGFHDGLQKLIAEQEGYIVDIKGKLIETFKELLQNDIDNLGAFTVGVSPDTTTENKENRFGDKVSLTGYHGTRYKWTGDDFDFNKAQPSQLGSGMYFVDSPSKLKGFLSRPGSGDVKQTELNLEKCFILTEDYISSISDINKILDTTFDETTPAKDVLTAIRNYAKGSKENSNNFRQSMLDMGYQGMYVGDYLANKNIQDELVVYDESLLKNLTSIPKAEFKKIAESADAATVSITKYSETIDEALSQETSNSSNNQLPISPALPNDFQQQLQNSIDESGKYIIKVYGELVKTFKEDLQEIISGLGAFPIEVKPYMRKGGEIEEIDLPGGNQNNPSSTKEFYEKFGLPSEALDRGNFETVREVLDELGGKYKEINEYADDFSEKKLDVEFLKDFISQLDLSKEKLTIIESLFEEISTLLPGGINFNNMSVGLSESEINSRLSKIRDISKSDYVISDEELQRAKQILNLVEQINEKSNETPVSTKSTEAETKALLSKKEVVEQLRTELNLTKKAAEELFNSQGYTSENGRYKIEKDTVDELILSLKKKNELEESSSSSAIPLTDEETEQDILNNLLIMLENIIKKVDEKTRAFQEEGQVVDGVIQSELTNLDVLSGYLINLRDEISKVSAEFQGMDVKINITDTGVDKVTKFVSALSKINDDKIEEKITRVFSSLDDFATAVNNIKINDNGILSSINNLLSKSKELENLASVLKESKKKIKEATKTTKEKNEPKNYASKYNRKLDSLGSKLGDDIGNYRGKGVYAEKYLSQLKEIQGEVSKLKKLDVADEKDIQELEKIEDKIKKIKSEEGAYSGTEKQVKGLIDKVNKLRDSGKYTKTFVAELDAAKGELMSFLRQLKDGGVAFDEIDDKVTVLAKNVEDTLAKKAFADFKQAAEKSLTNLGLKIDQIVAKNSGMGSYFESEFKKLREMSDTAESVGDVQRLVAAINKLESEMINAGKTGKSFIDQIKQRLRDINSKYIAQYFSFQDILRYARQAVTNVIQLNDAFIELSKVSNTALKTLEADFQSYADIAKKIGGTITDTINATADWARMGYSIPDAKELARVALLYKNVGDGIDISTANQSLISTLQGYQMQADEAEHIVDVFNEVANNYAIDTAGIGEALQRSAASLNAANTSLEQSVALVTAANTVVQNPESVGTTFKTLSARIRGAKTDLEELGEEEDEFTETTSKLQGLVKSLTGFDILEADQKTFKSIYDILIGIGDAWKDLDDIERASLGEALAGKRNANTLYAILDNMDTLKAAYETAENSAGSAMREQENYQKGITYSINQAKAALEELSYDIADSDLVKGLVQTGTKAINLVDKLIDKFGALKTLIVGIATIWGSKKLGLIGYNKDTGKFGFGDKNNEGSLFGLIAKSIEGKKQKSELTEQRDALQEIRDIISPHALNEGGFNINELVGDELEKASEAYKKLNEEQQEFIKGLSSDNAEKSLEEIDGAIGEIDESIGEATTASRSFKNVLLGVGKTLLNMAATFVIANFISDITGLIKKGIKELTGEAKIERELKKIEKANKNLKKSIDDLSESESKLANVESEISRINDEIASIQSKGKLTLTDEGDIERLSRQSSLLQSQQRILENNIRLQRESAAFNAKNVLDTGYTGKTYEVSGKSKVVSSGEENYSYGDWAKYYENAFITQSYNGYLDALSSGDEAKQKLYKEAVDKNSAEITRYISSLYEILQSFQDSEGNIISGYEDLYEEYTEMISNLQSLIDPNSFNQFLMDWSKDEKLNYNFEEGFNDVLEDMYGMEDFDFDKLRSMNEEFFDKLAEQGISDSTISAILNYKKSIYESVLQTINDTYDVKDIPELKTSYLDNPNETGTHLRTEDGAKVYTGVETELDRERQKLIDWGLEQYEDQIDSGILHRFGNIDMDKRAIITWSEELKETYKNELASWNYDPEIGSIDTVFGGYDEFGWGGKQHEIAFTPILQTEDGKSVLLSSDEVFKYIESVIDKAGEDGVITADEILKIDATETGKQFGQQFGKGLIAGIDESEGMTAEEVGKLMHFSGKYGAWNLAKYPTDVDYGQSDEMKKLQEATDQAKSSHDSLTRYVKKHPLETGLENLPEQYKHLKDLMGKNWSDDLLDKFTPEERQLALKIEVTDEDYDYDALKKKLQAKISPIEIDVMPKASDAVDSMADMKSAVASLSDLYNQTVLQTASENADSFGTFAADPATLNSIESAFDKFIQKESEAGNDVTKLNAALNEFQRTAVEEYGSPDYAEKMQVAIDNLITSYIDQTNIIKNLNEENAEWSKAQLIGMGIENADAVVKARLSKKTKELMTNVTSLAKSYDKLSEAQEGTPEYEEALGTVADDVKALLDLGENADSFTISNDFVVKNLDLIRDAAAGSADAINQLRKEAAKEIAAQVHIEGNTQEILGYRDEINNLINNFDIDDIEVGANLDDNAMIKGLNNLVDAGIITRDSMNNILSGIGVEPYRTPGIDIPIEVYDQLKGLSGQALTEASRALAMRSSIKVPGISYRVTSKATGAKYSAPSGGGSSSGGGGGGGGGSSEPTKPKEESEETFDWIEVAIQRIEEEIARLDKVVNNSYDLWGNRNKALVDELEKTTEEIKAQQLAQSEYLRNANLVQVNNGKGLNDDDYGENDSLVKANDQRLLDEARAAWATGEYQRKVREGQMSGDDIEKIQNHFLTEVIQSYQDLYNKSVQAGDAVQDLQIKLGDLAQTKFDHVKDEFDELIQYITDASDVINERINYTEKHGYFVSKSYYEDLKKLESQHNAYLVDEYEELIRKRDEAVASGAISEGSSAWNKMNQEINAVNLSIDQSRTQMLEYNNTIRQLDWDFFDWLEERISRINSEASFLVDLMSNDKLYEDNGFLNNLGHATNAMYAAQYETYMRQAQDYAKERVKLEAEIAKDPANKDLIARNETLIDQQQEMIKGAEQMKNSVKSLVQEGINLYLQSLQKLIDKYKESLSDARDLYSYQQNIADQTKNIGNLRKQLTAYEGDDSEETRATVQRLRTQLEDAEKKLKETEWDKYISETESFLSDMYTNMEETLNARLDNIDLLMHDMIDVANENSATVQDTIRTETDKVGYTLTSYLDGIINGGQTQFSVDLNNGFAQVNGLMTNVLAVIEQIKSYAAAMVDNGKTKVESTKTTTVNTNTPTAPKATGNTNTMTSNNKKPTTNTTNNNNKPATNTTNNNKPARSETDKYGVALAIINGNYGWGNGDTRVKNLKAKGFDPTEIQNLVNKLWNEGYVFSGAWIGRYHGITDISKFAFNKYAKGSKNISKDQLAWTQEKGQELIFRSSDGAMLTPLNAGDKVFTAQMTDNLWELAKGRFATNIPKSAGGNTINNSNAINITLPNVKNYEEFKTALQNDPKMTSFIQQITLGEVSNGVKLNKKKY